MAETSPKPPSYGEQMRAASKLVEWLQSVVKLLNGTVVKRYPHEKKRRVIKTSSRPPRGIKKAN